MKTKILKEIPVAEYKRIRDYLFNLIYRAGNHSVLLPSIRQLAADFHVTTPTVQKAVDSLKGEGFIEVRKGVGLFSKYTGNAPVKVVGFLVNSGKNMFNVANDLQILSGTGFELVKRNYKLRQLSLYGCETVERMTDEICFSRVDALLSVGSDPELLEAVAARGIPVAAAEDNAIPGCAVVQEDWSGSIRKLNGLLGKENRNSGVYISIYNKGVWPSTYQTFEDNLPAVSSLTYFPEKQPDLPDFRSWLAAGNRPSFIFIRDYCDSKVLDLLDEFRIDIQKECLLVSYTPQVTDLRFSGIQLSFSEERPKLLLEKLLQILETGKSAEGFQSVFMEFYQIQHGTVVQKLNL